MSAITLDLLDNLRKSGMKDEDARRIARSFDQRVEDALREAKAHSDRNRAESEEKAKTQFVSVADYHDRDKALATREDLNAAIAEVRKDIRALYRINSVLLIVVIAGLIAIIGKLYLGS